MNHCAIQQNAFSNREENRNSVLIPISERRNPVACPIPRRLGLLSDHPSRSLRFQFRVMAWIINLFANKYLHRRPHFFVGRRRAE
uniref:Uncharacterized protein n=1 Tax=Salix viminalis TaxID=40686 RepID=A0A6N2MUS1_SALVM